MAETRPEPDERDVLAMLAVLAGESRVYRMHLANASPVIKRLTAEWDDVAVGQLWTSVTAALSQPPRLGTPRNIEDGALRVLRRLKDGS